MKIRLSAALAIFLGLLAETPSRAAEKPLFASSDKIHISIQAPLPTLIDNRQFRGTVPGTLVDPSGQSLPITLRNLRLPAAARRVPDAPSAVVHVRGTEAAQAHHPLPR